MTISNAEVGEALQYMSQHKGFFRRGFGKMVLQCPALCSAFYIETTDGVTGALVKFALHATGITRRCPNDRMKLIAYLSFNLTDNEGLKHEKLGERQERAAKLLDCSKSTIEREYKELLEGVQSGIAHAPLVPIVGEEFWRARSTWETLGKVAATTGYNFDELLRCYEIAADKKALSGKEQTPPVRPRSTSESVRDHFQRSRYGIWLVVRLCGYINPHIAAYVRSEFRNLAELGGIDRLVIEIADDFESDSTIAYLLGEYLVRSRRGSVIRFLCLNNLKFMQNFGATDLLGRFDFPGSLEDAADSKILESEKFQSQKGFTGEELEKAHVHEQLWRRSQSGYAPS